MGMVYHLGNYAFGNIWSRTVKISGQNDLINAITAMTVVMIYRIYSIRFCSLIPRKYIR